jgi:hypothetical protein
MKVINHLDWQQHHPQVHFPSVDTILLVNQFPFVYNLLHVFVFWCLRKIAKKRLLDSSFLSVRPSICIEQRNSYRADFH